MTNNNINNEIIEEIVNINYDDLLNQWIHYNQSVNSFTIEKAIDLIYNNDIDDDDIDININSNININKPFKQINKIKSNNLLQLFKRKKTKDISTQSENKLITNQPSNNDIIIKSVGIDLGTTNSAISIIENGIPKIIPIDGNRIIPSIVAYSKTIDNNINTTIIVGEIARRQLVSNPQNTFTSIKRLIGKDSNDISNNNNININSKVLKLINKSKSNYVLLKCPELSKDLLPEEISSEVIKKLIQSARYYLGSSYNITRAVITVPAYFSPKQCLATENAGLIAGLEKVKLLREPEAAALAYGLTRKDIQVVLVFDLGGGTFDVSVLEVGNGFVEVIATSGDSLLGGDDFDELIANWIIDQFISQNSQIVISTDKKQLTSIDISNIIRKDPYIYSRINEAAIQAKISLSNNKSTIIDLPYLYDTLGVTVELTRNKFEYLSRKLFNRILKPLREVALMAGINLPGESGQLGINEFIDDIDDDSNSSDTIDNNNNQLKLIQQSGRKLAKDKQKLKGKTKQELKRLQRETRLSSLSLFPSGQTLDEVILVGGSTRIPAVKRLVKVMTGIDPKMTVNPDEAVSLGAAVLAGILDGEITDMQVMSAWQAAMYRTLMENRDITN